MEEQRRKVQNVNVFDPRWFPVKWLGERRRWLRSGHLCGRDLGIDTGGQFLVAQVVDSNDDGLGVEMSTALPIGLSVSFVGAGLQGRAQVAHCRRAKNGMVRVGLTLEEVTFCKLGSFHPALFRDVADKAWQHIKNLGR